MRERLILRREHVEEMIAHARACVPEECCGYLAGRAGRSSAVYPMRNVAEDRTGGYFADPADLFFAQRRMRECVEELLGIYHSHPRQPEPVPSSRDVRLAFETSALYFIIGFDSEGRARLRAFRLFETEGRWERAEFVVSED
ncbi:MAG TPA: M67 family metallopeptidase [Pyrinomonadaceae bacterium]|nr:M67 family metallopeptidase [Pyrinomonadaceae bacterium]